MITYDPILKIYSSDKLSNKQYAGGFSTRALGDGKKSDTLFHFFDESDISYKRIVWLKQIHSANVEVYSDHDSHGTARLTQIEDTDGVITKDEDVVLVVQTADCVPILFADKSNGIIGASHQGWRGSYKKLAVRVVEKMVENGAQIQNIVAAIGPSIGDCCYTVHEDRYITMMEEIGEYADKISSIRGGKRHVNLALLNYLLLVDAGMKKENIDFFPFCTSCHKDMFFSYWREAKNLSGEMFSFILRKS
ncbi:peptidoglycan editing factor PgeF [Candidatus Roizmanbacteria bacterium]|nr:peptidoglycan editing factor PgeF [Candidatus Roizmanbacteria bacterium]